MGNITQLIRSEGREIFSGSWLQQGEVLQSCTWDAPECEPYSSTLWPRYFSEVRQQNQPAWFGFENVSVLTVELLLDGIMRYQQNSIWDEVCPGEIYLIHPNTYTYFQQDAHEYFHRWRVIIRGRLVNPLLGALHLTPYRRIKVQHQDQVQQIFQKIGNLMQQRSVKSAPQLNNCTFELLTTIATSVQSSSPLPDKVELLRQALEADPQSQCTLAEIAAQCHCSVHTFIRIFKRYLGITPAQYRENLRLQRAQELLSATKFSIKEIAHQLGYCDQLYFATAFKRQFHTTPSEYRFREGR